MNEEETKQNQNTNTRGQSGDHYICLGGCRGVSKSPGACQAPSCANHDHALSKCDCTDDQHNNFEPKS